MNKITTYYAARKNPLVWLAALLCLCSAVARIVFVCAGDIDGMNKVVRIILPVAANLLLAFRLPLRGEKQFYVTVIPVLLLTWALCLDGKGVASGHLPLVIIALCIIFAIVYFMTFSGKIPSKLIVLILFLLAVILSAYLIFGQNFKNLTSYPDGYRTAISESMYWLANSDVLALLGILAVILSAGKMAPWKEGDPYRLRFGDRRDGRRVRTMPVMSKVTPYFMLTRTNRSNQIQDTIDIGNAERYVAQKRRDGYKHFGLTHILVAAYVRTIAEMPAINRFVAGQKIYQRFDTSVNMVVKKAMNKDADDSSIKVKFDRADTAAQVYEKFDEAMQIARGEGVANNYDAITRALDYLPSIIMTIFGLAIRFLDYFGLLPDALEDVSPFHGSLFITSMGSLGIPPIYHHLYDLGTVPVFCALGHKYTKYEADKNGEITPHKYLDYKIVCDEGICDGFYYAAAMKKFKGYMSHPEKLDLPPEQVVEDIE